MTKPRDSQRSRVYTSDYALHEITPRLETIAEINAFVAAVLNKAPIQRRYGDHLKGTITVHDGRGRRAACGGRDYIKMPAWSRSQALVLHEVAHVIIQRRHGDRVAAHGREFCAVYLDLVRFGIGVEAHDALKGFFQANRVRFRPKRGAEPARINPPMRAPGLTVTPARHLLDTPRKAADRAWAVQARKLAARDKREFDKLARDHAFTYTIERESGTRLAWIKLSPFGAFPDGIETMHMDWPETIDRIHTCLNDPSEVHEGGYSR
jgi:putative metallohydrolase (TIGR04338 family)